jgi:hypothetical protein
MRLLLRACCCLLVLAGIAFAQTDRGTITGTVTDPAGAVSPGAVIKAKNPATGAEYATAGTSTGNFTLAQLPSGTYDLTVTLTGFKTFVRQGITISAAQVARVDVKLEVGAISETVTVNADAPLLRTESGELSHNVRTDTLDELPVLSIGASAGSTGIRNPYAVMQIIPGADWVADSNVKVNGAPGNSQALRVEGMDATNNMWQQMGQYVQQGVDAIQEFSVQTSNYAAEFGQAGSAVFNLTMKSGTNSIHGTGYEYFVNEALNASTPFSEDAFGNKNRPRSRRHDFGFTLGGPIYLPKVYDGRDKSFFFFSFEEYRQNITTATWQTVPTLKMRNGDFSEILGSQIVANGTPLVDAAGRAVRQNQLYDYTKEKYSATGTRYWDPFPNNQIPSSMFDASSILIQKKFPSPDNNQLTQNWLQHTANSTVTFIPSVKIDYSLSAKAKISGYWSRNSFNNTADDALPIDISAGVPNTFVSHTARLNLDYTLKPTMLLHIGVGLMHNNMHQLSPQGVDTKATFGINTQAKGFPYIAGFANNYGGFSMPMGSIMNAQLQNIKPTANPSLTWIKGNHSYKFGGEMIIESHPSYSETFANNWFNFATGQTGDPEFAYANLGGANTGFPYASFLMGRSDWGATNAPSRGHLGQHSFSWYIQDSWKVTPKITLDYGLRYDYQTYLKEQYGRWANFSATTLNPAIINPKTGAAMPGATIFEGSGPGRCQCDFAKIYPYAFGPRLGIAWQILPKTVLRAGAGISYGRTPELGYLNNTLSSFVMYGFAKLPGTASAQLHDGPPAEYSVVWPDIRPDAFPKLPDLSPPAMAVDNNAGRPPRTIQWSIGLQREITKDLVVEASYIGNRGAWWQANAMADINGVTPESLLSKGLDISKASDRALLTTPYMSLSAADQARFPMPFTKFPTYLNLIQTLRPFPQFNSIPLMWAPLGRTWYDSLQVKVTKRYSHNFDLSYSFTYQKELTMGSELSYQLFGMIDPQVNDALNRRVNKYISGLSRPLMNVIAASYTVPKVFAGNRVLSQIARDWQISALLRYTSAYPMRVSKSSGNLNTLLARNANTYVNRVSGAPVFADQRGNPIDINGKFNPDTTFVWNPKAWSQPADGTFGTATAYYSDYRGRRHPTENVSLARNFRLGSDGRYNLQLRAEFNNLFNRLYIPDPDAGTAPGTAQTYQADGIHTSGGFGYINMKASSVAQNVRTGQIVMRFSF